MKGFRFHIPLSQAFPGAMSFPFTSGARFSRSVPKPALRSCRLYTGCHRARKQVSSRFVLKQVASLSFDSVLAITMRHRTVAGSAGGISPPAAHRTVRKPLDLHGSSQPFSCYLAAADRRGRSRLIPVSRLAATFFELSHPLRSTPITEASSLLRDDPPPSCASVLSPFVVPTYKVFPWHHMKSSQVPYLSPD